MIAATSNQDYINLFAGNIGFTLHSTFSCYPDRSTFSIPSLPINVRSEM